MSNEKKNQFSLTVLVRILLAVLIVASIGIFANSLMQYNELQDQADDLENDLHAYEEERDELRDILNEGICYETIVRIAKEELGLFFPDEEIFYDKETN